ncbi:F0F1 ATP synthase subunit A [Vagococcus acidifermentans]|uniref:ATP synthase subunit a n=1 Tax=Vagococcus acidifermentans TaxID=564710 RepID=A0A430ATM6_9ENTE|nr:F0F1 ATP synthase subunit A [Vagococcus acidifermentans]RSU11401.1 F0F1 ATP synthase subunit A [Vagococcus acidifermentans]
MEEKSWIINIAGLSFDGTICLMTILTCAIIFCLVYFFGRNPKMKPGRKQNALEYLVEFIRGIVSDNVPAKEVNDYHLLAFTFFMFILVSNLIGLVTKITIFPSDTNFWKSPTADPIVTMTLALIVVLLTNYFGIKKQGFRKFFVNSYMSPVKFLTPIKIMEDFTNVLTLGLRLYGNIYAGEVLLTLIASLGTSSKFTFLPALPLEVIWQGFSVFIGAIQAYIFVTLTMVYLSHKIEVEE